MPPKFKVLLFLLVTGIGIVKFLGKYTDDGDELPLHYNASGSFKIVQISDLHYDRNEPECQESLRLIKEVVINEKPDFVVYTGDNIHSADVDKCIDDIVEPVENSHIPWTFVFGNHDVEFGYSRYALMSKYKSKKYCMVKYGYSSATAGVGNYVLELKEYGGPDTKFLFYFFDSGSYTHTPNGLSFDYMTTEQVSWYAQTSKAYKIRNRRDLPALAFFHIPLPEYAEAEILSGEMNELICSGELNSGMFASFVDNDVIACFAGHDHDNDFLGEKMGVFMAYGRCSGRASQTKKKIGVRVIILREEDPGLTTYIYERGNKIVDRNNDCYSKKVSWDLLHDRYVYPKIAHKIYKIYEKIQFSI